MNCTPPALPRLLLVEDDPVSRTFLLAALQTLPAEVDCADTAATARHQTDGVQHALWLIDVNLPDGSGSELLAQLRRNHPDTPALAHTADTQASLERQLLADGFAGVLVKPLSRDALLANVRATLARRNDTASLQAEGDPAVPVWDQERALSALNGQHAHLQALRELFMGELPGVREALRSAIAANDDQAMRQQLHRLQASCGFVGAAQLAVAARRLHQQPGADQARRDVTAAIDVLLGS